MLLNTLSNYLGRIEVALQRLEVRHIEKYEEEILSPKRVNLRIRVRFLEGSLLELNEAVTEDAGKLKHLSYRYHFQDKDNKLIFRYDNTPHFPHLETFPNHKHLPNQVTSAEKPTIEEIFREVNRYRANESST